MQPASAEIYDPATGIWTPTGSLTGCSNDFTATLLLAGRVLVAGGGDERVLDYAELYAAATGMSTISRRLPPCGPHGYIVT